MSERHRGYPDVAAFEFAFTATKKTLEGALAHADESGRKSIIETQRKRLEFYLEKGDPESQGKADAIKDIIEKSNL